MTLHTIGSRESCDNFIQAIAQYESAFADETARLLPTAGLGLTAKGFWGN